VALLSQAATRVDCRPGKIVELRYLFDILKGRHWSKAGVHLSGIGTLEVTVH
jgi:hypothetical protein